METVNRAPNTRRALQGYVSGVLCTQFVNSALHLAQPILMADLTHSLGGAALFSSFDTAVHMCGTYLGGWPTDRFGARRVLVAATFLRGLALAAIPLAMWAGELTATWAAIWYTVDALVRGFVDASAYTVPLEIVRHESEGLDRMNSRFELAFDAGGIAGPLALGALLTWFHGIVAHAMIPVGFALAAMAYSFIPETPGARVARERGGSWEGAKAIFRLPELRLICLAYMTFNLYPLRKLLSAFFAKSVLQHAASAGVVGSAFGAGGFVGTLIYTRYGDGGNRARWIVAGAAGVLALAFGWVPASLAVMCAAAFFFAMTNAGARLTLTRARQELTPLAVSGGVTAASRFGANLVSVGAKALLGAAFAIGGSAVAAFSLVAVFLSLIALGQFALAGRFGAAEPEAERAVI